MVDNFMKSWKAQAISIVFLLFTIWWIAINKLNLGDLEYQRQIFAASYGIIALVGGIWGLILARQWGFTKSVMGRAIIMFSLGLFAQEFGQLAYSYYIYYVGIEVPYPSWGDIGYFGSIPLYIYGILLLAKAAGVRIRVGSLKNKLQAIIIPLVMLVLSYVLFLQGYEFDWSNPLIVFLDFGYPMGQAIYISLAILTFLLSRTVLGGVMKNKILFVLFALLVQYVADYIFLFQANRETWYAGGVNDYMYLVSYFLMTLALLQLEMVLSKLRTFS